MNKFSEVLIRRLSIYLRVPVYSNLTQEMDSAEKIIKDTMKEFCMVNREIDPKRNKLISN